MRFVLMLLGLGIIITPWTMRNYAVLGIPVLISTNGGDVFYRANNPLAKGDYTKQGAVNLFELDDEVKRDRLGYRLGRMWIAENPLAFAKLIPIKQILFLGDDGYGAFETMKRGLGIGDVRYIAAKAISNAFWLTLWMFVFAGALRIQPAVMNSAVLLPMAVIIGFVMVHSVFEANGRYHIHFSALVAVLALSWVRETGAMVTAGTGLREEH